MDADLTIGPPGRPEVRGDAGGEDPAAVTLVEPGYAPQVDPTVIRGLLVTLGGGVGYVAGDDDVPEHWHFTEQELDQLAGRPGAPGALTRWVNRQPRLVAAAERGDELLILTTLAGYTGRNVVAGRLAARRRLTQEASMTSYDEYGEAAGVEDAPAPGPAGAAAGREPDHHDGAWLGPADAGPMAR